MTNILTAKELGKFLRLSEGTVNILAQKGEIAGFKIQDTWHFDMDEVILRVKKREIGNNGVKEEGKTP